MQKVNTIQLLTSKRENRNRRDIVSFLTRGHLYTPASELNHVLCIIIQRANYAFSLHNQFSSEFNQNSINLSLGNVHL